MQACEPCQDRKVAAISNVLYVFGISWAFIFLISIKIRVT